MVDEYLMKKEFEEELVSKRGLSAEDAEKEYAKLVSSYAASLLLVAFGKVPEETRKSIMDGLEPDTPENQKKYLQKIKEYLEKNKMKLETNDYSRAVALAYTAYEEKIKSNKE